MVLALKPAGQATLEQGILDLLKRFAPPGNREGTPGLVVASDDLEAAMFLQRLIIRPFHTARRYTPDTHYGADNRPRRQL